MPVSDVLRMRRLRRGLHSLTVFLALPAVLSTPTASYAQTSASPFGFQVQVELSPRAADKLRALGEGVSLSSFYYGDAARKPSKADIEKAEQDGQPPGLVEIAGDTVTIAGAGGTADMPGQAIGKKQAALYGKNVVRVNVNVFSARLKAEDNLLDCALFDDEIAVARARTVQIFCRLIGEE